MSPLPPVLIEHWLPIEAIGAESKRERSVSSALPPLYFLHVWWARRPLTTSRAAIIGSVLPAWSTDWPSSLKSRFPTQESYYSWFQRFLGILGDPVLARKMIDFERSAGIETKINKYGYPRAFNRNPSEEDLETLSSLLDYTWGTSRLIVADPFSGGGSIPFEALRFGFTTLANDLNPVACTLLKGTLDYPAQFGMSLSNDIQKWGHEWAERVKVRLEPYFRSPAGQLRRSIYMWARTVACPVTGKPVPLATSWWIRKGDNPIAVQVEVQESWAQPKFRIRRGKEINFDPDIGSISQGVARSPWTGETVDGDYIKREAQAGRMGAILYCVEIATPAGRDYVEPITEDELSFEKAKQDYETKRRELIARNLIPTEEISDASNYDRGHRLYGIRTFEDFYSPRQMLAFATILETLKEIKKAVIADLGVERGKAVLTYLGLSLDIAADYNCYQSAWHSSRLVIAHVFTKHNFSMTWSFTEFDAAEKLIPWAVFQVFDAYRKLAKLSGQSSQSLIPSKSMRNLIITQGSATNLHTWEDNSIHNITVDPPYYDNVMYAELSDFFYVWLKRSVGDLFPEFFNDELTNKDDEAVANQARFKSLGKKKKELAEKDYELKMAAAFREMHRVLTPEGVLTVMFTHKKVEAWDTLASALIGAGFTIKASWPVHTESEHSMHLAKKNAATSTILLVCRKRQESNNEPIWWDDIQARVRETARNSAVQFAQAGILGVDLYISTFGPTLSIISEQWPVLTSEIDPKTGEPKPLRPETALELARQEVVHLQKQRLLLGRDLQFDPVTDWYIMAWDAFHAEQFPYDEARKLALAIDVDLDKIIMASERLVVKKGNYVVIQTPSARRKNYVVD